MLIGERIRAIREAKDLSQGDVERRSGLIRAYISRVENNHVVPSLETLEKFAHALSVPLYQFFYEGAEAPNPPPLLRRKPADEMGMSRKEIHLWRQFRNLLARMSETDRRFLLAMARKMARR